jgi:hypothetical protein
LREQPQTLKREHKKLEQSYNRLKEYNKLKKEYQKFTSEQEGGKEQTLHGMREQKLAGMRLRIFEGMTKPMLCSGDKTSPSERRNRVVGPISPPLAKETPHQSAKVN